LTKKLQNLHKPTLLNTKNNCFILF